VCLQEAVTVSTPLTIHALASWVTMAKAALSSIPATAPSHLARMEASVKGGLSF